jgi:hypothetical protein
VTRPGRGSRAKALADQYAQDPVGVVLQILRRAAAPMTAAGIKKELMAGGVARVALEEPGWRPVREGLAQHANVSVDSLRYSWNERPRTPSPVDALELIAQGRAKGARKTELLAIVRGALTGTRVDSVVAARQRQAEIDAARALAELASEVEELVVNEVSATTMIHRVRSRVRRSDLEPVDRAGEETTFDRKRHKPISGSIRDGAPVVVVRPGYVWKAPTEDLLVVRPVVEE